MALQDQATRAPKDIAVRTEEGNLSYGDLHRRAGLVASRIASHPTGVRRVAVHLPRGLSQIVALVGTALSPAAQCAVDVSNPPGRIRFLLADFEPDLLVTDPETDEVTDVAPGVPRLLLDRSGLLLDEHGSPMGGGLGSGGLVEGRPVPGTDVRASPLDGSASPDDVAYYVYTSGSTGKPKATGITHDGLMSRLCWLRDTFGLSARDRLLYSSSCSFDASIVEIYLPLISGAQVVVAAQGGQRDPDYLATVIQQQEVSVLHMVPSLLDLFLLGRPAEERYDDLRVVVSVGEKLSPDLVRRFQRRSTARFFNGYGPSECSIYASIWECPRDPHLKETLIGFPAAETDFFVVDPDGRFIDDDTAGELFIGGTGVGQGYWKRPELTAASFRDGLGGRPGRFYRTGDLVRRHADGSYAYLGRVDRQVKIRGYRIEPSEIEKTITADPAVRQAVVLPLRRAMGTVLAAVVVLAPDADADTVTGRLAGRLRDTLPDYMCPAVITPSAELPLTENGKLDLALLAEWSEKSLTRERTPQFPDENTPTTPTEQMVIAAWRKALSMEDFATDDDFFDLGGDSLAVLRVIRTLEKDLRRELSLNLLYSHSTVKDLAAALDSSG